MPPPAACRSPCFNVLPPFYHLPAALPILSLPLKTAYACLHLLINKRRYPRRWFSLQNRAMKGKDMRFSQARRAAAIAGMIAVLPLTGAFAQDTTYDIPVLEGRAVLPADTFVEGPASGAAIAETFGRVPPFDGQPVQGISSIIPADNGNWYGMQDNGFGAKGNSADVNLRFFEFAIDFEAGSVEVVDFTELHDPNNMIPFAITNADTEDRVLTGADFDLESFRHAPDGTFWFGEEFGPFLLHTDAEGVLLEAPIPTPYPAELADFARGLDFVQSPQNPDFFDLADDDARIAASNLARSTGFEGMAISPDGATLYPLLEGGLLDDTTRGRLFFQAFDIATQSYTDDYWYYQLSIPTNSIGEMTAVNDHQFLVIERDNNQGVDAAFKRVFLIDINVLGEDGHSVTKTLVADLLSIYDPNGITTAEDGAVGLGPIFKFPFQTIESIYPVDADTLLIVDDNNYPFSNGRRPGVSDDNEFILVGLPQPLDLAE